MISSISCKDHIWFPGFFSRIIYDFLGFMQESYMISSISDKDHIWFPWSHAKIVLGNTLWFVWHHIWSLYGTKEAATRVPRFPYMILYGIQESGMHIFKFFQHPNKTYTAFSALSSVIKSLFLIFYAPFVVTLKVLFFLIYKIFAVLEVHAQKKLTKQIIAKKWVKKVKGHVYRIWQKILRSWIVLLVII